MRAFPPTSSSLSALSAPSCTAGSAVANSVAQSGRGRRGPAGRSARCRLPLPNVACCRVIMPQCCRFIMSRAASVTMSHVASASASLGVASRSLSAALTHVASYNVAMLQVYNVAGCIGECLARDRVEVVVRGVHVLQPLHPSEPGRQLHRGCPTGYSRVLTGTHRSPCPCRQRRRLGLQGSGLRVHG
jgi:hypothetical protein